MSELVIRNLERDELALAVEWAAREGWNPGNEDAEAFWAADPGGFFAAELDGEVIGVISGVRYGETFGFVGFYIVKPEFRGHRCGVELAERAMAGLRTRCVGIDGVLEKERQYGKLFGFELAHRNLRYGGVVDIGGAPSGLTEIGDVPLAELAAYDRRFFPADREAFLGKWIAMGNSRGLVARDGGGILGYGVIRECREGWKIGPLFANDPKVADWIFRGLCAGTAGQMVYIDVPEINVAGVGLAERFGMAEVFATARMYLGGRPDLPVDGIFGITTFELG